MASFLAVESYETIGFSRGEGVLREFHKAGLAGVDLLITDFQLPGMSGLDLVTTLRAYGFRAPVIMITGYLDSELEEKSRKVGIATVLSKPAELAKLHQVIRGLLLHQPLRDGADF